MGIVFLKTTKKTYYGFSSRSFFNTKKQFTAITGNKLFIDSSSKTFVVSNPFFANKYASVPTIGYGWVCFVLA